MLLKGLATKQFYLKTRIPGTTGMTKFMEIS